MPRRYIVSSLSAALERIRAELGPDAVVLETRTLRPGFLWVKPVIEVLATESPRDLSAWRANGRGPMIDRQAGAPSRELGPRGRSGLLAAERAESERSSASPPSEGEATPMPRGGISAGEARFTSLPAAVRGLSATTVGDGVRSLPESLEPILAALRRQALDEQLAADIVFAATQSGGPDTWSSPERARQAITAELERRVQTTGPVPLDPRQPTVMAIVGPTGVGKTTTIAKLAASAKAADFRVALVTVDTFRVAATQQLETYGELLGAPVSIAYDPAELGQTVRRLHDFDLILIDTPGCGRNNRPLLEELERFLAPLGQCDVHLALACGSQFADMLETTRAFAKLPLRGLILTKLDEAVCFGPAVSLIQRSGRAVSYLTTGQNIAADVEVATARRLAELVTTEVAA